MRDFKIERARSSMWNHKYDFRPELHDPKFNYHFIRFILKSHNFMALKRFDILFSMQNDVIWQKLIQA